MPEKVGIIGLGRTGLPAAKALIQAGYEVYGYDIHAEKQDVLKDLNGIFLGSPQEVAKMTRILLVMVLNDEQVKEVVSGRQGLLQGINPGSVIVCMSTINRSTLEEEAGRCQKNHVGFIDCPFTGGPARIPGSNLTLIVAGPEEDLNKVAPVLEVLGKINVVGKKPGLGQAVKHCNQLLVGVTHAATMEVITLARAMGLDAGQVREIIASGIAGSDYFRLLSESVLKKTPSPGGLGQMCKDVSIVMNTTRGIGLPAYTISGASQYFTQAKASGMEDREGADLIEIVEKTVGIKDENS